MKYLYYKTILKLIQIEDKKIWELIVDSIDEVNTDQDFITLTKAVNRIDDFYEYSGNPETRTKVKEILSQLAKEIQIEHFTKTMD